MARKPATRAAKPAAAPAAAKLNGVVQVAPPTDEEKAAGKVTPATAQLITSPVARLRFKASRPTYRRGGLVLNDRGWTEVDAAGLEQTSYLALLFDPVVSIEGAGADGIWTALPPEARARLREAFAEGLAAVQAALTDGDTETGRQ